MFFIRKTAHAARGCLQIHNQKLSRTAARTPFGKARLQVRYEISDCIATRALTMNICSEYSINGKMRITQAIPCCMPRLLSREIKYISPA